MGKNWNKAWAGILDQVEEMNLSKADAKVFLEKRLREMARKEGISKYNAKAVKGMRRSIFSRLLNSIVKAFPGKC